MYIETDIKYVIVDHLGERIVDWQNRAINLAHVTVFGISNCTFGIKKDNKVQLPSIKFAFDKGNMAEWVFYDEAQRDEALEQINDICRINLVSLQQ